MASRHGDMAMLPPSAGGALGLDFSWVALEPEPEPKLEVGCDLWFPDGTPRIDSFSPIRVKTDANAADLNLGDLDSQKHLAGFDLGEFLSADLGSPYFDCDGISLTAADLQLSTLDLQVTADDLQLSTSDLDMSMHDFLTSWASSGSDLKSSATDLKTAGSELLTTGSELQTTRSEFVAAGSLLQTEGSALQTTGSNLDITTPRLDGSSRTHSHSSSCELGTPDKSDQSSGSSSGYSGSDTSNTSGPTSGLGVNGSATLKPSICYIEMIGRALLTDPQHRLLLGDIYSYIRQHYPYYQTARGSWRNSVRHNLCVNVCFMKDGRSKSGRGFYWAIHPACLEMFEKGDFRRMQARQLVQRMCKTIRAATATARETNAASKHYFTDPPASHVKSPPPDSTYITPTAASVGYVQLAIPSPDYSSSPSGSCLPGVSMATLQGTYVAGSISTPTSRYVTQNPTAETWSMHTVDAFSTPTSYQGPPVTLPARPTQYAAMTPDGATSSGYCGHYENYAGFGYRAHSGVGPGGQPGGGYLQQVMYPRF